MLWRARNTSDRRYGTRGARCVCDNLGLETVWYRCQTVLVSDAGTPFAFVDKLDTDWMKQTLRAFDVAIDQTQVGSDRRAHPRSCQRNRQISPGQRPALQRSIVKPLAKLGTRLTPFTDPSNNN